MALADLVRTVAPAEAAVTLNDAKAFMNVEHNDHDATIALLVEATLDQLEGYEGYLGRVLITQTWALRLPAFPAGPCIDLPLPPLQAVTGITYRDRAGATQTLPTSQYIVIDGERARVVLADGESWPDTEDHPRAVTVTFRCGYGDTAASVPGAVRQAALMIVADAYDNRAAGGAIKIDGPAANLLAKRRRIPT